MSKWISKRVSQWSKFRKQKLKTASSPSHYTPVSHARHTYLCGSFEFLFFLSPTQSGLFGKHSNYSCTPSQAPQLWRKASVPKGRPTTDWTDWTLTPSSCVHRALIMGTLLTLISMCWCPYLPYASFLLPWLLSPLLLWGGVPDKGVQVPMAFLRSPPTENAYQWQLHHLGWGIPSISL